MSQPSVLEIDVVRLLKKSKGAGHRQLVIPAKPGNSFVLLGQFAIKRDGASWIRTAVDQVPDEYNPAILHIGILPQLRNNLPEFVCLSVNISNDRYGTVNTMGNRRHGDFIWWKKGGSHLATEDEFGGCQAAGRNSLLGVNQVGGKQRGDNQPVVVRSVPFQRR
jgi:hypothetical protein